METTEQIITRWQDEVRKERESLSNCCSAKVYAPTDEWSQCMDCKEYCGAITEEE